MQIAERIDTVSTGHTTASPSVSQWSSARTRHAPSGLRRVLGCVAVSCVCRESLESRSQSRSGGAMRVRCCRPRQLVVTYGDRHARHGCQRMARPITERFPRSPDGRRDATWATRTLHRTSTPTVRRSRKELRGRCRRLLASGSHRATRGPVRLGSGLDGTTVRWKFAHSVASCRSTRLSCFANRASRSRLSAWPSCGRCRAGLTSRRTMWSRSSGPTSAPSRAAPCTTPSACWPTWVCCGASSPPGPRRATRIGSATTTTT